MLVCNSFGISTCKMCDLTASYGYIAIVFALIDITVSGGQQWVCKNNTLLRNNARWKCVEEAKCGLANKIPGDKKLQCGVNKICCPEPLHRSNTSQPFSGALPSDITRPSQAQIDKANLIALHKCYEYKNYIWYNYTRPSEIFGEPPEKIYNLDCHETTESLLADVTIEVEKEYPHMALLGYEENVKRPENWRCGGSLISEQFILSAAHCTKLGINTQVKWALLGKLDRRNISLNLKDKNLFRIVERINHPHYKVGSSAKYENNDIALYKLEKPIKLSSSIRPICLYHNKQTTTPVGARVAISGWGALEADEQYSDTLKKAIIKIVDNEKCIEQFKTDAGLKDGFDSTTMICAGDLDGYNDWCRGDSGGPLVVLLWAMECMYLQIGVVSRGLTGDCGHRGPTIFTNVSYYLPWIQSVVWPTK